MEIGGSFEERRERKRGVRERGCGTGDVEREPTFLSARGGSSISVEKEELVVRSSVYGSHRGQRFRSSLSPVSPPLPQVSPEPCRTVVMESIFRQLSAGSTIPRGKVSLAQDTAGISSDAVSPMDAAASRTLHPCLDFFSSVLKGKSGSHSTSGSKRKHDATTPAEGAERPAAAVLTPPPGGTVSKGPAKKPKRVRIEGDLPPSLTTFDAWHLSHAFQAVAGATSLMEVQARVAPCIDAGLEVIAVAPTGSGKTLAYTVPLIKRASERNQKNAGPGALVVVPTKELAHQISSVMRHFVEAAKLKTTVQIKELLSKAHMAGLASGGGQSCSILVATPMRLIHALRAHALDLARTTDVVLDEADKLFEDGFVGQIDEVLAAVGRARIHLFTATLPSQVEEVARTVLKTPVKVVVGGGQYGGTAAVDGSSVQQKFVFADGQGEAGKITAFRRLLAEGLMPPTLVFVQSQDRAAELFRALLFDGVNIDAIHAGRTQAQREDSVMNFRSGKVWILIATELLARGIDFQTVNTVINYDLPATPSAYVHRIGRTGRAGRTGKAITFFTEEDKPHLRSIVNVAVASGAEVPKWMLTLPVARRHRRKKPKHREEPDLDDAEPRIADQVPEPARRAQSKAGDKRATPKDEMAKLKAEKTKLKAEKSQLKAEKAKLEAERSTLKAGKTKRKAAKTTAPEGKSRPGAETPTVPETVDPESARGKRKEKTPRKSAVASATRGTKTRARARQLRPVTPLSSADAPVDPSRA